MLLCLLLTGCASNPFDVQGRVASDGGGLGGWSSTPQGCSRGPVDGLPPDKTAHPVTFVWEDPGLRHPMNMFEAPDAPMRLEFWRSGGRTVARLETRRNAGVRLDDTVCTSLRVEAAEEPSPLGRPGLAGTAALDCRVAGSHVTASLKYARCQY